MFKRSEFLSQNHLHFNVSLFRQLLEKIYRHVNFFNFKGYANEFFSYNPNIFYCLGCGT